MIYNGGTLHGHHLKQVIFHLNCKRLSLYLESLKVVSSAEIIGLGGNYSCLVLDGDESTISRYEETVKSNSWYSFINGRDKDTTVEVLNSFTYPKDKNVLVSDIKQLL